MGVLLVLLFASFAEQAQNGINKQQKIDSPKQCKPKNDTNKQNNDINKPKNDINKHENDINKQNKRHQQTQKRHQQTNKMIHGNSFTKQTKNTKQIAKQTGSAESNHQPTINNNNNNPQQQTIKPTNKQTNKQTSKQTNKQQCL